MLLLCWQHLISFSALSQERKPGGDVATEPLSRQAEPPSHSAGRHRFTLSHLAQVGSRCGAQGFSGLHGCCPPGVARLRFHQRLARERCTSKLPPIVSRTHFPGVVGLYFLLAVGQGGSQHLEATFGPIFPPAHPYVCLPFLEPGPPERPHGF